MIPKRMTKHTHTKRTNGIPWDHVLLIKKKKKKSYFYNKISRSVNKT